VTYHLPTGKYEDHGIIRLEDGRYPAITQSIAVHPEGRIYTVPMFEKKGDDGVKQQCDLVSFEYPGNT
jgi:hypothetical protein